MLKEHLFSNRQQLFNELAQHCREHLTAALQQHQQASLLVSGGSTPSPLYESLSESNLDWKNVHVALVDERWVDKDHSASNAALIAKTLLINQAGIAPFTGMKTAASTAIAGREATEAQYQLIPQPYTVTILGMGNDGHTASLFPHAEGLDAALDSGNQALTAAITARQSTVTGVNTERLSLTLHGLLQSERLILLLTGEEKLEVLRTAMQPGDIKDMPIRALLQQNAVPLELFWAP